jgi:DUF4097 and DUF4098 domain-containing protein YvlB
LTQSGEVSARGKYGDIEIKIGNGEIDFKGSFTKSKLQSANGDIDVKIKGRVKGDLGIKSVNGDIEVEFKNSDVTINGSTANGKIHSEHRAVIDIDDFGSKISGSIDKGTYKMILNSVNGDIKLLKQ